MKSLCYLIPQSNAVSGKTEVESLEIDALFLNQNLTQGEYELHIHIHGKKERKNAVYKYKIPITLCNTENGYSKINFTSWDDNPKNMYMELVKFLHSDSDIEIFSLEHRLITDGIEDIEFPNRVVKNFFAGSTVLVLVFGMIFYYFFLKPDIYNGIYVMKSDSLSVSQNTSFFPFIVNGTPVKNQQSIADSDNHYLNEVLIKLQTKLEEIQGDKNQLEMDRINFISYMIEKQRFVETEIRSLEALIDSKKKLFEGINLQIDVNKNLETIPRLTKQVNQLESDSLASEILSMNERLLGLRIKSKSFENGIQIESNDPGDSNDKIEKIASFEAEIKIIQTEIEKRRKEQTLYAWCDCVYIQDYFFDKSFRQLHLAKDEQYVVFEVNKRLYPEIIGKKVEVDGRKGEVIEGLTEDQQRYLGFSNHAFITFKSQVVVAKLHGEFNPKVFGHSTIVTIRKEL